MSPSSRSAPGSGVTHGWADRHQTSTVGLSHEVSFRVPALTKARPGIASMRPTIGEPHSEQNERLVLVLCSAPTVMKVFTAYWLETAEL